MSFPYSTSSPAPTAGPLPIIERANKNTPYSGGGGGGGTIPSDLVVSTLTATNVIVYPNDGDLFTRAGMGSDGVGGVEVSLTSLPTEASRLTLKTLSTSAGIPPLETLMTLNADATGALINAAFSNGAGGLQPAAVQLAFFPNGQASLYEVANRSNFITIGGGDIEINTQFLDNLRLNGAPMPGIIVSTPMANPPFFVGTDTEIVGPNTAIFMTSTFATRPGIEYRISWSDTLTCETGTPGEGDSVGYRIDNVFDLERTPLSQISTLGLAQGVERCHNYTWVATNTDTQLEFINNTTTCSTSIRVTQNQPIRIQRLGPYFDYSQFIARPAPVNKALSKNLTK